MSQATGNFDFLQRAGVNTEGLSVQASDRQIAQGLVQAGPNTRPSFNNYNQDNISSLARSLTGAIDAARQQKEKRDYVSGQLAQAAGKTRDELIKTGASKATQRGYMAMETTNAASLWYQEQQNAIRNGTTAEVTPEAYAESIQAQFNSLLTGNSFTDEILADLTAHYGPKLIEQQALAHSNFVEQQTFNNFTDLLTEASVNNEEGLSKLLEESLGDADFGGLNKARRMEAVTNATVMAYERNSPVLGEALGLHELQTRRNPDGTPGNALLGQQFTTAQQERLLKARESYLNNKKNSWSYEKQLEINNIFTAVVDGRIGFSEAQSSLENLGLNETMLKAATSTNQSLRVEQTRSDRAWRESIHPNEMRHLEGYARSAVAGGNPDRWAQEAFDEAIRLGKSREQADKAAAYVYNEFDKADAQKKAAEHAEAAKLSPTETATVQLTLSTISSHPSSVDAAIEEIDFLLKDKPEATRVAYRDMAIKAYADKVNYDIGQGNVPQGSMSSEEWGDILKLKYSMAEQYAAGGSPGDALAASNAELNRLAEMYGWTDRQKTYVAGLLQQEGSALNNRMKNDLISESVKQRRAENIRNKAIDMVYSGTLVNGNKEEREIGWTYLQEKLRNEVQQNTFAQLGDQYSDEAFEQNYAVALGQLLAENDKYGDNPNVAQNFLALGVAPPIDGVGQAATVDKDYINNYLMYQSLADINPQQAAKYVTGKTATLMENIRKRGGLDSPDASIIGAWAAETSRPAPSAETVNSLVNSSDYKEAIQEEIADRLDEYGPGIFRRIARGVFGDVFDNGDYTISDSEKARALNDPALLSRIENLAVKIQKDNPLASVDEVVTAAVNKQMNNEYLVGGKFLTGSAQNGGNLLLDCGIDPQIANSDPMALNNALYAYMDEFHPASGSDFQRFGTSYLSPTNLPPGQNADRIIAAVTDRYSNRQLQLDAVYSPTHNAFVVTRVGINDQGDYDYSEPFFIPAEALGGYYNEKVRDDILSKRSSNIPYIQRQATEPWVDIVGP